MIVRGVQQMQVGHHGHHGHHQPPAAEPAPQYQGSASNDSGGAVVHTPEQQAAYQQALLIQQQQQARFQGLLAAQNQSFATTSGIFQAQNAATNHNLGLMYAQGNSMAQASHDARVHNMAQRTQHNQDFVNAINGIDTYRYTWQGPASGPYR
jgi:hypothetical protein